jgi:small conductance mechanosensitive channel
MLAPLAQALAAVNLGDWAAPLVVAFRIVAITVAAWLAKRVATRLIRGFRERVAARMQDGEQVKRAETLGRVCRYLATVTITLIAGVLILSELGVSVAPILGAAGVIGLAVGFGAQSLVKDYFIGFFILLENQIIKGDVVQIADKSGMVEDMTLRYVRLRDYDGNVHVVPNGLIGAVTNMSRGFAYSVVDVGIAYREDVDEAFSVMRVVADELARDTSFGPQVIHAFEIAGVERWDDSAVILRCRFRVRALEQWNVRREYLRRLKAAFDSHGIEIPYPHLTLYAGAAKNGTAPPINLTIMRN